MDKITVLGAGIWGSVLAGHIAKNGYSVTLWEYDKSLFEKIKKNKTHPNIKNFKFPGKVTFTHSLKQAVTDATVILVAIQSKGIRHTAGKIAKYINPQALIISASKGIEEKTCLTMSEVIEDEIKPLKNHIMVLSGPSFAQEVADNVPTKLILADKSGKFASRVKKYFDRYPFSIEISKDRKTVELGGALKNVFAIGCGMIDKKFGDNTRAALITQCAEEMNRIIKSRGGHTKTAYGFSGLGDFILTATSFKSRNALLGQKLANGLTLSGAKKQIKTSTEGVNTIKAVITLINKKNVYAPITKSIYNIVCRGKSPENLLKSMGFKKCLKKIKKRK